jgi:hypothetical protein
MITNEDLEMLRGDYILVGHFTKPLMGLNIFTILWKHRNAPPGDNSYVFCRGVVDGRAFQWCIAYPKNLKGYCDSVKELFEKFPLKNGVR